MAKLDKQSFIAALKEMNIKEVMELVEAMKEEFGINPSAVAAAPQQAAEETEEKSEVTLTLNSDGGRKVAVIKVIKDLLGMGLMDAKKFVESAPVAVKENIKPEEAEEIKQKLTAAGAEVTIA